MNKIIKFIKEAIEELGKVSWPTRDAVIDSTIVVVVSVIVVSLILGIIDRILSEIVRAVIK